MIKNDLNLEESKHIIIASLNQAPLSIAQAESTRRTGYILDYSTLCLSFFLSLSASGILEGSIRIRKMRERRCRPISEGNRFAYAKISCRDSWPAELATFLFSVPFFF